jgi:hypothetical protein
MQEVALGCQVGSDKVQQARYSAGRLGLRAYTEAAVCTAAMGCSVESSGYMKPSTVNSMGACLRPAGQGPDELLPHQCPPGRHWGATWVHH